MRTYDEINAKIKKGRAVVLTADDFIKLAEKEGVKTAARKVDVVTTATFGPMCSSGVLLNFGHSDPPIKMQKVWLNDVPAYGGLAAVDVYLGATELSESKGMAYGGAHVIEDMVRGKKISLKAVSYGTDCYPRKEIKTKITLDSVNQAVMFNPRNAYQNYAVAVNSSDKILYTYMGTLLPKLANATYATTSRISPLMKDPTYRALGVGTRIFLGGAAGYVAWSGTQHNPAAARHPRNKIPYTPAGTLAVIGDLKKMTADYVRAAVFEKYGATLFVGIGAALPVLDEEMARSLAVSDDEMYAAVVDYGVPARSRPKLGRVSYRDLRDGYITVSGKKVPTAPLSSYARASEICVVLKKWLDAGKFFLSPPVERLPLDGDIKPLEETE